MSLTLSLMMSATLGLGPQPVSQVRPLADVIEIRPQMVEGHNERRDQIRFPRDLNTEVVGQFNADGSAHWAPTDRNQRERLGGQDAPALIYVRASDAVFAIDPFEPLPTVNELNELYAPVNVVTARMLFGSSNLETDRAMYAGRQRIEQTQELFNELERARNTWLRDNGYYSARTFRNPNASSEQAAEGGRAAPEPAGWFRKPDELPRGRSREAVQAEPQIDRAQSIASALLSDGEARISMPPGVPADTAERVAARNDNADSRVDGEALAVNSEQD